MLRHVPIASSVLLALLMSIALNLQTPSVAAQADDVTIAGCLQTGANEGEFTLVADDKQVFRVEAADTIDLAAHANHRVELTGTVEKSDTSSLLKAAALRMVAESCEG